MTEIKRFVVNVDAQLQITITDPDQDSIGPPRTLRETAGGSLPPPDSLNTKDRFLHLICGHKTEMAEIRESYDKIYTRKRYDDGDLKAMGGFLFDKLIGADNWTAIQAKAGHEARMELALLWDDSLQALHRFNWELMHGPDRFLAADRVSITRLVSRKNQNGPKPFHLPPRLLFVVGTRLTDGRVRPGAEYYGLLSQLEHEGLTVHPRVLQRASLVELRAHRETFEPDIIHFVCHGDIGLDGEGKLRGYLELQAENKREPIQRFGDGLLDDLEVKKTYPSLVILSACHSATLPALGVRCMGSLAAELVAGGVPTVVGMGGRVSDLACRLFIRRFGEGLIKGESLVAAMTEGRRAAFIDRTPKTIDWAFPTLFLAQDVPATYAAVKRPNGAQDPGVVLGARLKSYGVPKHPVFCSRHEFFEKFEQLFEPSGRHVLAIWTRHNVLGMGRTRLLQELATQALRDGHVPVLVSSRLPNWEPNFENITQLAIEILRAIARARESFDLPLPMDGPLLTLLRQNNPIPNLDILKDSLDPQSLFEHVLKNFKGTDDLLGPQITKAAMQGELALLIQQARAKHDSIGESSRTVLLLDQVHHYADAVTPLLDVVIDEFGLGTMNEVVPVIFCYSKGTATDEALKKAAEHNSNIWRQEELKPFQTDDEDMLAYEQVMLHPDPDNLYAQELAAYLREKQPDVEGAVATFAYDPQAARDIVEEWTDVFRKRIKGIPKTMISDRMYLTIEDAHRAGFLVAADDETKLSKLREES